MYQYKTSIKHLAPTADLAMRQLCMRAISQVTGHRVEDITPDMHLEADLGLDSIKMVALFGALMQELPQDRRELLGPGGFFSDMVRVCTVEDLLRSVEHLSTAFADGAASQRELAHHDAASAADEAPGALDLRRAIVEAISRSRPTSASPRSSGSSS